MINARMMRMLLAAGLACLGMALAGLGAACDSEPQQSSEAEGRRLDAMIGQMIMIGFEGRSEREPDVVAAHDQLAQGVIGGVVLYPDNIGLPEQLRALFDRIARAPLPSSLASRSSSSATTPETWAAAIDVPDDRS